MKNVDRACISRISIKPCKLQERTAGPQGEALINAGKMSVKGRKAKKRP